MPIRPPPLKLKYDNRFPLPIPSARRPKVKETFFSKLYQANWKNIVIAVAGLNVLRHAFSAVTSFEDADVDKHEHASNLAKVNIALCAMYAISCVIQLYGIIGVSLQRFALVRVYTFLAFVSALLVTAASVLNAASFFLNAEELMYECVALAMTGHGSSKSQFRTQPWPGSVYAIGLRHAQKQCTAAWTQDSWTEVVNVFLFGFVPSLVSYIITYTYYRQTIDPAHPANLSRQSSGRTTSRRSADNQGEYTRVAAEQEAPVEIQEHRRSGNPRSARQRAGRSNAVSSQKALSKVNQNVANAAGVAVTTSRSLKRPHRPPALKELEPPVFSTQPSYLSGSPAAYSISPGPPTYGIGPARLNIGAYMPVAVSNLSCSGNLPSARYDKFV